MSATPTAPGASKSLSNGLCAAPSSAAASYHELLVEQRERILFVAFNRPAVRNALNRDAYYEIIRALRTATDTPHISTVVFTGAGDYFTAGNDLTQTRHYTDVNAFYRSANYVLRSLVKAFIYCPKVLVALVNGPCYGVGFTLCALCDVVYCSERAYFEAPFSQLGLCPEAGATRLFPLLLGRSKATTTLLFGERLSAPEAFNCNFVAGVYAAADWETTLWPKIVRYSCLPAVSLRVTKRLMRSWEREELLRALRLECSELERLRGGETYRRAVKAYIAQSEKRNKSKLRALFHFGQPKSADSSHHFFERL